jgi:hypothetical protein
MQNKNKYFAKSAKSVKKGDYTINGLPVNDESMYQLWQNNPNYRRKSSIVDSTYNFKNPAFSLPKNKKGDLGDFEVFAKPINNNKDKKSFNTWRYGDFENLLNPLFESHKMGNKNTYRNDKLWQRQSQLNQQEKEGIIDDWENYNKKKKKTELLDRDISSKQFTTHMPATQREYKLQNFANPESTSNAYISNSYFQNKINDAGVTNMTSYAISHTPQKLKNFSSAIFGLLGPSLARDKLQLQLENALRMEMFRGKIEEKLKNKKWVAPISERYLAFTFPADYVSSAKTQEYFNPNVNRNKTNTKLPPNADEYKIIPKLQNLFIKDWFNELVKNPIKT